MTIGSIAIAAAGPIGASVRVDGVVVAVRQLGKVSFVLLRDAFSEIQVVVAGELQKILKDVPCPFYATISGVLKQRPPADARPGAINGTLELQARELQVLPQKAGRRPLAFALERALRFAVYLQSRGFLDVNTLAKTFAPSFADLMNGEELNPAIKYLTHYLAPCRWYSWTGEYLYFGLSPGSLADLQSSLAAKTPDEYLERATWHEEQVDAAPFSYGAVRIRPPGEAPELVGGSNYWRNQHSIAHLSDLFLEVAAARPKLDDVTLHRMEEGLARGQVLLQAKSGPGRTIALRDFPPEYDLNAPHLEQLLKLFPSLEKHLARSDREQQFEILWSILGHDHVKAIFSSPEAVGLLSACIGAGLFADYNVIRSVDHTALKSIRALTRNFERKEAVELIDKLFTSTPTLGASACYLLEKLDRAGLEWEQGLAVAKRGIISELAFRAAARKLATPDELSAWRKVLAASLERLFTNDPVDESACLAALNTQGGQFPWIGQVIDECEDVVFDLVNLTFGPGLVAYEEAARIYSDAEDTTHHWAAAGINFGGERWNKKEGRFDLTHLDLYPSKNRAAILAKSCSGICSARDARLFHRNDHFQFTLVDRTGPVAAGTVQLYTHRDEEGRELWVLRGLNPSEKVSVEPIGFTIEILDTLASLARHNNVNALVYADGAGLFHADSGREAIRTVLRRLATTAKKVAFEKPLHLFDYHERPISIEFGWQIWP